MCRQVGLQHLSSNLVGEKSLKRCLISFERETEMRGEGEERYLSADFDKKWQY